MKTPVIFWTWTCIEPHRSSVPLSVSIG